MPPHKHPSDAKKYELSHFVIDCYPPHLPGTEPSLYNVSVRIRLQDLFSDPDNSSIDDATFEQLKLWLLYRRALSDPHTEQFIHRTTNGGTGLIHSDYSPRVALEDRAIHGLGCLELQPLLNGAPREFNFLAHIDWIGLLTRYTVLSYEPEAFRAPALQPAPSSQPAVEQPPASPHGPSYSPVSAASGAAIAEGNERGVTPIPLELHPES